jgi:hypothetical protein
MISARTVQNIAGRITAAGSARAPRLSQILSGRMMAQGAARVLSLTLAFSGRVGGKSQIRSGYFVTRPVAARISSTSRTSSNYVGFQRVSGRVTASSFGLAPRLSLAAVFSGSISGAARGRFSSPYVWVTGRVAAVAQARLGRYNPSYFARISAAAQIQSRTANLWQVGQLSTTIRASGRARIERANLWVNPPNVAGRIAGRSTVSLRIAGLWLVGQLTTRIAAQSQIRIAAATLATPIQINIAGSAQSISLSQLGRPSLSPEPLALSGTIGAAAISQTSATYGSSFGGWIAATTRIGGAAQNRANVLFGRIGAAAKIELPVAEIQAPLPLYPPPFPTHALLDYVDLITSEHNQKPKYTTTVGLSIEPVIDDQQLVASLLGLFDLDYSVGQQEDFTGQWIGKSRWIELPAIYFSWDVEGAGWNQANWKGPMDAPDKIERLDDYHYRLLLYATVIANHWDGSIPKAYEAWDTLFAYAGLKVIIQDYGNMTMLYGLLSTGILDNVLLNLFLTGQMDLRPEGVELRAYALQPEPGEPFFAWDASSESVLGWDSGYWGVMVPPGQAYIPHLTTGGNQT